MWRYIWDVECYRLIYETSIRTGPRVLATGMQMSNDIQAGKKWKASALDHILENLKQVACKPFQLGSGVRRQRTRRQKNKKYAFIHEGSHECTKSELDLFSVHPTQD